MASRLLTGFTLGLVVGILLAPEKGSDTRKKLTQKGVDLKNKFNDFIDSLSDKAEEVKADIIGLSGLITPSLDEMVHVAKEMNRRGMKQPLMIGGATTSRMHTAVKIAGGYDNGVVHVLDASRSVTVAGSLLSKDNKKTFLAEVNDEYEKLRIDFANKQTTKQYIPFEEAQANPVKIDWDNYTPPVPSFTGTKVFEDYDIAEIRQYIDWGPFFRECAMFTNYLFQS